MEGQQALAAENEKVRGNPGTRNRGVERAEKAFAELGPTRQSPDPPPSGGNGSIGRSVDMFPIQVVIAAGQWLDVNYFWSIDDVGGNAAKEVSVDRSGTVPYRCSGGPQSPLPCQQAWLLLAR